jgi:hypothetical protein
MYKGRRVIGLLSVIIAITSLIGMASSKSANVLLINDMHLNIDATEDYAAPGDETTPKML